MLNLVIYQMYHHYYYIHLHIHLILQLMDNLHLLMLVVMYHLKLYPIFKKQTLQKPLKKKKKKPQKHSIYY